MKSGNFNDIDTVLKIRQKILNLFDNFEQCCKQHLECLKEQSDIEEANIIYDRELEAKNDLMSEIKMWIGRNENPSPHTDFDLPLIEPSDSVSLSGSNESSHSSTATKLKMKAKADQAVAELRLRQLKEEQDLQERIEEMTMRLQIEETIKINKMKRQQLLLKAQHEIEQRNTELNVYENAERVELDKSYDVPPGSKAFDFTPKCSPKESTRIAGLRQVPPANPFATPMSPIYTYPLTTSTAQKSINPFTASTAQTPINPFTASTAQKSTNPFKTPPQGSSSDLFTTKEKS